MQTNPTGGQPPVIIFIIMTITRKHKEYEFDGETWFVEQYADKPDFVWFWRYGYIYKGMGYVMSDRLFSRPNLKRIAIVGG